MSKFERSPRAWDSGTVRREADLFWADLVGVSQPPASRFVRSRPQGRGAPIQASVMRSPVEVVGEAAPAGATCGFFGPTAQRSEAEVRRAIVERALSEWTAFHPRGTPLRDRDPAMIGRILGYYLGALRVLLPATVEVVQARARDAVDYRALLAASGAQIDAEASRIATQLLRGLPQAGRAAVERAVASAVLHARQAHRNDGAYKAWSAVFVSACVRGAAIALGLEALDAAGQPSGGDGLLLTAEAHLGYAKEAYLRRHATPPRRGTYHAFAPADHVPRLGDIIVQDRAESATRTRPFASLGTMGRTALHGDIVVEVRDEAVITIGGNVGDSVRKRRLPRHPRAALRIERALSYAQEGASGALPAEAAEADPALGGQSTARVFAVLSLVEDCRTPVAVAAR